MLITSELMAKICAEYPLDPLGIHGLSHWARVREFGLRLAAATGADPVVVELFSVFHDSQRRNENRDPQHGARGALLAKRLHGEFYNATPSQLETLCRACAGHTKGKPEDEDDITILTCWDTDRLDLLRVGITPDPKYLCTDAARDKDVIEWACTFSYKENIDTFFSRPKMPSSAIQIHEYSDVSKKVEF